MNYTYDKNGNVSTKSAGALTFFYDIYNQLRNISFPGAAPSADYVKYAYNNGGERIFKEYSYHWQEYCEPPPDPQAMSQPSGPESMLILSESIMGPGPIGGGGQICYYSSETRTFYAVSSGKVLAEYNTPAQGVNPLFLFIYAGDQRIAMRTSDNKLHYFLNDHLGSARVVIDSVGVIKDKYTYYAFGSSKSAVTNTGQDYKYTGKPLDDDGGINLYYYGARYYDAFTGRFGACDPLAGKYPGESPYVYTLNNPLKFFDPDGQDAVPIVFKDYLIDNRKEGLGHAGILLIDNKNGQTKYWDYGRFGDENGVVRNIPVSDVVMDAGAGMPTKESLTKVLEEISTAAGKSGDITAVYIKNDEFKAMNEYAKKRESQNKSSDKKKYNPATCNCSHFVKDVLKAGGVETHPMNFSPIPNQYIEELRKQYNKIKYDAEKRWLNEYDVENR